MPKLLPPLPKQKGCLALLGPAPVKGSNSQVLLQCLRTGFNLVMKRASYRNHKGETCPLCRLSHSRSPQPLRPLNPEAQTLTTRRTS